MLFFIHKISKKIFLQQNSSHKNRYEICFLLNNKLFKFPTIYNISDPFAYQLVAGTQVGSVSFESVKGVADGEIENPDLVKNFLPGSKNFVLAGGYRGTEPYETGDQNAFDDIHGHGSHVAGSIAGNGKMLGVAPNTGIRSYRVFGQSTVESAWIFNAMIGTIFWL